VNRHTPLLKGNVIKLRQEGDAVSLDSTPKGAFNGASYPIRTPKNKGGESGESTQPISTRKEFGLNLMSLPFRGVCCHEVQYC